MMSIFLMTWRMTESSGILYSAKSGMSGARSKRLWRDFCSMLADADLWGLKLGRIKTSHDLFLLAT